MLYRVYSKQIFFLGACLLFSLICRVVTLCISTQLDYSLTSILKTFFFGFLVDLATLLPLFIIFVLFKFEATLKNSTYNKAMSIWGASFFGVYAFIRVLDTGHFSIFGTTPSIYLLNNLVYPIPILKNIASVVHPVLIFLFFISLIGGYWLLASKVSESNEAMKTKRKLIVLPLVVAAIMSYMPIFHFTKAEGSKLKNVEVTRSTIFNLMVSGTPANHINYKDKYFMVSDYKPGLFVDINNGTKNNRNVIMIVGESFAARNDGKFPYDERYSSSPRFSRRAGTGMYLSNYYAATAATSGGLSALYFSQVPMPFKFPISFKDSPKMTSLVSIVKDNGYNTSFIYGGDLAFNERERFVRHPGLFDTVVDKDSYDINMVTINEGWGVNDEFVFSRAVEEIDLQHDSGKPFFSTILTLSNHHPYTFDDSSIEGSSELSSADNLARGINYTDHQIDLFINSVKNKPWFKNTIFVITADHGPVFDPDIMRPVSRFHIPLLIWQPEFIKPEIKDQLLWQGDLTPTLLQMLGISYKANFAGKSFINDDDDHVVYTSNLSQLNVLIPGKLISLFPEKLVKVYDINKEGFTKPSSFDLTLHDRLRPLESSMASYGNIMKQ